MNTALWTNKPCFVDNIQIHIPTIDEILGDGKDIFSTKDEEEYMEMLGLFVATPASQMVALDDIGINFTEISDYELFLVLFKSMDKQILERKSGLFFENIRFSDMDVFYNESNDTKILRNSLTGTEINELTYCRLSELFCSINNVTKEKCKPASESSRQYFIEKKRRKLKRAKRKKYESSINNIVVALVNNKDFKYNYETVGGRTIAQINLSLQSILKKYQVDNLNYGLYSGSISNTIDPNKLNWLDINK